MFTPIHGDSKRKLPVHYDELMTTLRLFIVFDEDPPFAIGDGDGTYMAMIRSETKWSLFLY